MEECTSAHTLFICSLVQTAGWFAKLKTIVEIALFDSIVIEDCCFFCNFMVSYSILIYTFVSMNYKLITWFNLYCFVAGFRYWWHVLFLSFFLVCRERDSNDMRKKLPFCVGLLLRLLRKNHRVYITCTTGFDRSPSCVIAYLHWMTDTSLPAACNFVTGLHTCKPDRFPSKFKILCFCFTWSLTLHTTKDKGVFDIKTWIMYQKSES